MNRRFQRNSEILIVLALTFLLLMAFSNAMAAAVQSIPDSKSSRQKALMSVDTDRLRNTVQNLENYGNRLTWENQWDTAKWLEQKLKEYGLDVAVQTYEFRGRKWPNVIAQIKGHTKANDIILLIAHIDSTSDNQEGIAPGADDNGSGVSVLIEIARILKKASLEKTVMFGLFSNEEHGNAGSKVFAGNAKRHKLNIHAVINLDVLGYNAPDHVSPSDTVQSHRAFKHRLKSLYRLMINRVSYYMKGRNWVIVAGQKGDASLIKEISAAVQVNAGLGIKEITDDACV